MLRTPHPKLLKLKRSGKPPRARAQGGVALIEVLVALLIFMLGVLGVVGLQTSMTRAQTESKVRADAAALANELVGRMWTDVNNIGAYDTRIHVAGSSSSCAASDRCVEWQDKVASALPSGSSAITVDPANGDVTIQLRWAMPGGDTHQYVTNTTVAKAST